MTPNEPLFRPDCRSHLGHEIPAQAGRWHADRPDGRGQLAANRPGACRGRERPRPVGRPLLRGAGGLQIPARRPDHGRRGHGAQRHPLQLLRHGHCARQPVGDFRAPARSGPDHAAGRRDRLRLLDHPSQGRGCAWRGSGRLGAAQLHGRVGRDVPHHHVGRQPSRRDDGDDAVRSPRYRGFHHRQVGPGPPAYVQHVGSGHRSLHGSREGRRVLGPDLRRQGVPHRAGARPVEPDHAVDLRLRRAGRHLHRPHQHRQQSGLLRNHCRHQPLRRAAPAALRGLPPGLGKPRAAGIGPVHGRGAAG